jgi:surface protein
VENGNTDLQKAPTRNKAHSSGSRSFTEGSPRHRPRSTKHSTEKQAPPAKNGSHEQVIRMMFHRAYNFDQDLSSWNTSSVEDLSSMLQGASSFNKDLAALPADVSRRSLDERNVHVQPSNNFYRTSSRPHASLSPPLVTKSPKNTSVVPAYT